ncbi:3'-5' exonuclease [Pleomorphomonas carboxyditropha]|uniref:DNA 3'-5' helicase n=1 Tax=Pleomorphomonas carboxyditropha TaxID=2023338 RepID=A0A2G9WU93_9HYPH|nr:3'-5' exonuclease [Pleomorphomonas carboxyditropha]PIO98275.1 DNA helicase [Pleomorphomonas carboxyditropha]
MSFLISDTFTSSLGRLTAQEQKAVKTTAFDLQMDPSSPGLSMHRIDNAKDPNFWSVRVSGDIRLILHKTGDSVLLAYVDHHDDAYRWAERRRLELHPTTGAMQLVEIRERVELVDASKRETPARAASPKTPERLFDNLRKFELMAFGVPGEWVDVVREATEDTLFDVIAHLPQEAQETLLKLAVGEKPEPAAAAPASQEPVADGYAHPDAQRRFRLINSQEDLALALEYPWEKWTVFLHPAQRTLVERAFKGPARVSGSAGTGKTIVALHRAVHLARAHPQATVLLTTFSKALANALKTRLDILTSFEPDLTKRIAVQSLSGFAYDLHTRLFEQPNIAPISVIRSLLTKAAANADLTYPAAFLVNEWNEVVDAWQIQSLEAYLAVPRLGRKTRLGAKQRETLWSVLDECRKGLAERKLMTWAGVFDRLSNHISAAAKPIVDYAVVDEAQDLGPAEARFLGALCGKQPDGLFFAGDLGQRIFQQPFSWKAAGLDVRGRSYTLRLNYRTSHQIRAAADRLLPTTVSDVDGLVEERKSTVSVFEGPEPSIATFGTEAEEVGAVAAWIKELLNDSYLPHEIAVIVRAEQQLRRARDAAKAAGVGIVELSDKVGFQPDSLAIGIMHFAKGLEFRAVAVMACDDEVLPLQERIETVTDEADLEEVYTTERHLLYVAATRARERLLLSGVDPASEFLTDLQDRR